MESLMHGDTIAIGRSLGVVAAVENGVAWIQFDNFIRYACMAETGRLYVRVRRGPRRAVKVVDAKVYLLGCGMQPRSATRKANNLILLRRRIFSTGKI